MTLSAERSLIYPDYDGQPMADNTRQFQWIVFLKENLERWFAPYNQIFVAGDLLWYPVEGRPDLRVAPDVLVVFGRPKGHRGSYQQWREGNIAPQVVFEILSPRNRLQEMAKKQEFYNTYGVEEYYLYDPEENDLCGFIRVNGLLTPVDQIADWISPCLGIRFELTAESLALYRPDGEKFLTTLELEAQMEAQRQRAETEYQRAERLAAQLRALGIEPKE
ncbi:Uma2 family endonuclease [Spirulina sp. CCNP1310]|uniref:Uma2 family endonuclease n=1 Tax=Spirulina sp. CCNP1310 TaxID=3110249 RepID=UPI002B1F0B25|nr:Uma2 family endonuclease [Spirulina sp. CCNP1310]MEA5421332.1 Uma2 family endonuclease [Spirulina sp. CCNP1310]